MWVYFDLEGAPCRVKMVGENYETAQMYKKGRGFVNAPMMTVLSYGVPISKQEFDTKIKDISLRAPNE